MEESYSIGSENLFNNCFSLSQLNCRSVFYILLDKIKVICESQSLQFWKFLRLVKTLVAERGRSVKRVSSIKRVKDVTYISHLPLGLPAAREGFFTPQTFLNISKLPARHMAAPSVFISV